MPRFITKLFKRGMYVKPLTSGVAGELFDMWIVCELNVFESFKDDWQRYDLRVAIHNFVWQLKH